MALEIRPKHVFLLVSTFIAAWLYTEISERIAQAERIEQWDHFMGTGGRFTADNGRDMCRRVAALERHLNISTPIRCEDLYQEGGGAGTTPAD